MPDLTQLDTIAARSVLRYLNNHTEKKYDPKLIASMRLADVRAAIASNYAPEAVAVAINAVQIPRAERKPHDTAAQVVAEAQVLKAPIESAEPRPAAESHAVRRDRLLAELDELESDDLDQRITAALEKILARLEALEAARDGI